MKPKLGYDIAARDFTKTLQWEQLQTPARGDTLWKAVFPTEVKAWFLISEDCSTDFITIWAMILIYRRNWSPPARVSFMPKWLTFRLMIQDLSLVSTNQKLKKWFSHF